MSGIGTPPPEFRQEVRPEWIDYNGHLSEAYYVLVFGFATDALMDHAGLDAAYRDRSGCSLYTVEAHVRYLREVSLGEALRVTTRVLSVSGKKLRFCHEMRVDGQLVATEELLALHVGEHGTVPFPEPIREPLSAMVENSPEYVGRSVG